MPLDDEYGEGLKSNFADMGNVGPRAGGAINIAYVQAMEDLRLRAGGGAPAPDAWESAMKVRRAALLLDYIFTVRNLRVVLWWPNHKTVSVIPMTGSDTVTQINCLSGRVLVKSGSTVSWPAWQQLMLTAADDIVWIPPASAPSAGSLTVAQIQERLKTMGGQVTGNRQILWNRLMWLQATTKVPSNDEPDVANVP